VKVKRALISVSDKTGLEEFVKGLNELGIEIISTGGTSKKIRSLGIKVTEVSELTGLPEMMDGRVKTLHPKIHAALLALRDNKEHMQELKNQGIDPIDMVVVNLYPFEKTISSETVTFEEAIENIDIGGPTMLRSAAKNFKSVAVLSSSKQYQMILNELKNNDGEISEKYRKELARIVFLHTSKYDGFIERYLKGEFMSRNSDDFPLTINDDLNKVKQLRYGENPHQNAALYRYGASDSIGIVDAEQFQGKELSFNNILDLNAVFEIIKTFKDPAVAIVKHSNPCGVAFSGTVEQAFIDALESDPISAFGGIIGSNRVVDGNVARTIMERVSFFECIIAPEYENEALAVFSEKKNLRVLKLSYPDGIVSKEKDIKKIPGGILIQDTDTGNISRKDIKIVTEAKLSEEDIEALFFGWNVVKFVKSNAIVLTQGTKTVGIGAGQMSRVDSVLIAIRKAGERAEGSFLASDAFFPKPDSIEAAHKAGIKGIIQPGGSIRDQEIIDACDKIGMPMIFTGMRHFRH